MIQSSFIFVSVPDPGVGGLGRPSPLTKTRGWLWLYKAYFSLNCFIFWPLFCMEMDKKPSASRGLCHADPHHGLYPWTPLGAPTPNPHYRLELRAHHGPPPSRQIVDPPLICFVSYLVIFCCYSNLIYSSQSLPAEWESFCSICCFLVIVVVLHKSIAKSKCQAVVLYLTSAKGGYLLPRSFVGHLVCQQAYSEKVTDKCPLISERYGLEKKQI